MNIFSKSIFTDIINRFPEFQNEHIENSELLELEITNKNNSSFGGLVIQTTADNQIWVRNYQRYSGYYIDNTEELIEIINGIFSDEILWVIGFKKDTWTETTLILNGSKIEMENGVTYYIYSWSGMFDKKFEVNEI